MVHDENSGRSALLPLPPLLITESEEEFNRILKALYEEITSTGERILASLASDNAGDERIAAE